MQTFNRIKKQLEFFKNVRRIEIMQELKEASELGDLYRENHPFDIAVSKQRINERRILELEELLKLSTKKNNSNTVQIGSSVYVKFTSLFKKDFKITLVSVEQKELDKAQNLVSIESPLGKAICGKKEDDGFEYFTPLGEKISGSIILIH